MKKLLIIFSILLFSQTFASDKLHVKALEEYSSLTPHKEFRVEMVEGGVLNENIVLLEGDVLNCVLFKTKDPTRAKRDAKIFFKIVSYENPRGLHLISEDLTAKYAKTILNKERIKQVETKNVVKKVGGTVANFFVQGASAGISFVDGVVENKEDNRLKSGVKQVYDDSFLSYIEYGEEIDIKVGDKFYLIVKEEKD